MKILTMMHATANSVARNWLSRFYTIHLLTQINKIMEPQKKNTPNKAIVILFSLIILTVVVYFILQIILPELFQNMPTGEVQPVKPNE